MENEQWEDENDAEENGEQQIQPNNDQELDRPVNRARRSNKKERRKRNTELRREMQRQRDAAIVMGFGAGDENGGGVDEARAMNCLIEE